MSTYYSRILDMIFCTSPIFISDCKASVIENNSFPWNKFSSINFGTNCVDLATDIETKIAGNFEVSPFPITSFIVYWIQSCSKDFNYDVIILTCCWYFFFLNFCIFYTFFRAYPNSHLLFIHL